MGGKYKKIKPYELTEQELREIWHSTYCAGNVTIFTLDGVLVKFYEDQFDHCFYESANRKQRDKSILSLNRLEKIYWIKDTLEDPEAILKSGWLRDKQTYNHSRRLALVKENYVVIIRFIKAERAKFVTAYEINDDESLEKINESPDWKNPYKK
ncbi:hypothetical protein LZ575_17485 [Antarcticibacterium sp. 1MA-6-2]|uniref:hypothetical protein n=1 Tax=Antarcticibacterium sp. 1MA-6-2 TaxID=2908210 RepID=UPI001F192B6B|nr:hypothetical protein [Antarcticibacterium sp. 1MA-6-2]UJH90558.1 hypothetical protein LZ575_17485 [Antarcticibacterium sp. 1MA-6-2]